MIRTCTPTTLTIVGSSTLGNRLSCRRRLRPLRRCRQEATGRRRRGGPTGKMGRPEDLSQASRRASRGCRLYSSGRHQSGGSGLVADEDSGGVVGEGRGEHVVGELGASSPSRASPASIAVRHPRLGFRSIARRSGRPAESACFFSRWSEVHMAVFYCPVYC